MAPISDPSGTPRNAYRPIPDFDSWMHARVDDELFGNLMDKVAALERDHGSNKIRWAQDRILRASAFETGAVEDLYRGGITFSVAMEIEGWQMELADAGDGAEHHFDDQLAAYVWVREMPSVQERPLTEAAIRELHTIATRSHSTYPVLTPFGVQQQSFTHGTYKLNENLAIGRDGRISTYCPAESVNSEMQHLVAEMRSGSFNRAHPVIRSAYVQWALAHIHPFADGNGRIARVLASIPLFDAYGVPLVVLADRKRGYLQALEAADQGDYQAIIDYVAGRASDTLAWLTELIEGNHADEDADQSMLEISRMLEARSEPFETREEAAERVRSRLAEHLQTEAEKKLDRSIVTWGISYPSGYGRPYSVSPLMQYARVDTDLALTIAVLDAERDGQSVSSNIQIGYSNDADRRPIGVASACIQEPLWFSLEDCSPDLSISVDLRLRNFATIFVVRSVKMLEQDLTTFFRQHGRFPTRRLDD